MQQITNISKEAVRPQIVTTALPCASLNERHTYQGSLRSDFPGRSFEDGICVPNERLRG